MGIDKNLYIGLENNFSSQSQIDQMRIKIVYMKI